MKTGVSHDSLGLFRLSWQSRKSVHVIRSSGEMMPDHSAFGRKTAFRLAGAHALAMRSPKFSLPIQLKEAN